MIAAEQLGQSTTSDPGNKSLNVGFSVKKGGSSQRLEITMASDLDSLVNALRSPRSMKLYRPVDPEAEAAKIARLRQLRLAREAMEIPQAKVQSHSNCDALNRNIEHPR